MQVKVDIKSVEILHAEQINSGEYNTRELKFEIAESMQNLILKALFTKDYKTYEVEIQNDICIIPWEVLKNDGNCELGVYGYSMNGEKLELRYSPEPDKFYINAGSYKTDVVNGEEPTPTRSEVLEGKIKELDDKKVDKEEGKVLSTNDFTNELKEKLEKLNTQDDKVIDGHYDEENKEIVLTLTNGNEVKIPVNDLLDDFYIKSEIDNLLKSKQDQIDELTAENKQQAEQISYLDKTLVRAEAEGETIHLTDSAEYPISKISIDTNIKQETREGYNLIDSDELIGKIVSEVATQDYNTALKFTEKNIKANTEYVFVIGLNNVKYTEQKFLLVFKNASNTTIKTVLPNNTITFTEDEISAISYMFLYWNLEGDLEGDLGSKIITNLMLTETTNINKPYEQYGSMPSIEFSSEIKTPVGKQGFYVGNKNLLKIKEDFEEKGLKLTNLNDCSVKIEGTATVDGSLTISDYFKIKGQKTFSLEVVEGNISSVWYWNKTDGNSNITLSSTNNVKTINFDDYKELACAFTIVNGTSYSFIVKLQVEDGTVATDHTPHQSQVQDLDLTEELLGTIVDKEDGAYFENKWVKVFLDGVSNKFVGRSVINENNIYNTNQVAELIKKSPSHDNNKLGVLCNYFKENIINKMINEDIQGFGLRMDYRGFSFVFGSSSEYNTLELANKFLIDRKTEGNPVYVIAPLETPTYTKLSETQQAQWNKIKKMHTYEGVTNIYTINDNGISPVLNLEYVKSPEILQKENNDRFSALENAIVELGGVL